MALSDDIAALPDNPVGGQVGINSNIGTLNRGMKAHEAELLEKASRDDLTVEIAQVEAQIGDALTQEEADTRYAANAAIAKKSAQAAKAVSAADLIAMTAPPTIAVPPSGTTWNATPITSDSLLAGPVHIAYDNTAKLRPLGGILSGAGTGATFGYNSYMFASNFIKSTMRVSWYTDAPDFEFLVRHTDTNGAVRLIIDGQWAGPAIPCNTGDGLRRTIRVQTGSRKLRLFTLELDQCAFGGLNVTVVDSVTKGPPPVVRSVFFGDSYVQGSGATRPGEGLAYHAANLLGWEDAYTCGQSGTGYLRPTTTPGFARFIDRIATHLTPLNPTTIVVLGGLNDNTFNDASYTVPNLAIAAQAFYQALNAALPLADVFVVGPQTTNTPNQLAYDKCAAVKAAALAQPNVKLFIDPATAVDPWITGTGKVGSPAGNGNADVLLGTDGAHPSQLGHDVYAARISNAIKGYYLGVAA